MKEQQKSDQFAGRELDVHRLTEVVLSEVPVEVIHKARRIRLFLCDVDGVLTDGGVYIGGQAELKRFNIRDGFGLRLLQEAGIRVGWISHRYSDATTMRARELGIELVHQAGDSKVKAVERILSQLHVDWDETAYMGDDIVDLGVLKRVGLSVSVPNAIPEAKQLADYVTRALPGHGAVREIAELILRARGTWASLVERYVELE